MYDPAPQELLVGLRQYYGISFIPTPIRDQNELRALLGIKTRNQSLLGMFWYALCSLFGKAPQDPPWFVELWEEYVAYDSILAHDNNGSVYRFIRTVTLFVVRDRVSHSGRGFVRDTLAETIEWPDGSVTARAHNNTTSEKIHWKENGRWMLIPRNRRSIVRRAAWEEFGIKLTRKYLKAPWLRWIAAAVLYYKDAESGKNSTHSVKMDDPKRPGVTTYNRLYHAFLKLDKPFWKDEYREEKRTKDGRLIKTMVHRWTVAGTAP